MKKFIVTATRSYSARGNLVEPHTFSTRAWTLESAKLKVREQGMCLESDSLHIREAAKNAEGEYIE